jgi:hypothetical protein
MTVRLVTFRPLEGHSRYQQLCQVHRDPPRPAVNPFAPTPSSSVPHRFVPVFFDDNGTGQCELCVAEGLRAGGIDISNPQDLEASRPKHFDGVETMSERYESAGIKEARNILAEDRWGEEALQVFEAAIEALDRSGRLGEIAERLLEAVRENAS